MHPGLQRTFLNVIRTFDNYQYFLTTHSNHFLDITLDYSDVSIYTFRKAIQETVDREILPQIVVENVSNEDRQALELLGVRNSSVFLSNCTIWIEGITDRRYLNRCLRLYYEHLIVESKGAGNPPPKEYKEDLHYSFVEYGGSCVTHWSFLTDEGSDGIDVTRLCGRLFLIADRNDEEKPANQKRHKLLMQRLTSEHYYRLKCREIENLLAPAVIRAVVKEYEGEKVEFTNFTSADYRDEYLGKFIEEKALKSPKRRTGSYAQGGGTVSDKVGFCDRARKHLKSFDDLSDEAKELTITLYDFIRKHN
jgi:predicted ATP-dependent endonuclease of OLD family